MIYASQKKNNLIVIPQNLLNQWIHSIHQFSDGLLTYKKIVSYEDILNFYDDKKQDDLNNYDILITTSLFYHSLATTLNSKYLHFSRVIFDEIDSQLVEYTKLLIPNETSDKIIQNSIKNYFDISNKNNIGVWVFYPWNNHLVHLLDENKFVKLRTARNMYKISEEEQLELKAKKIGIIGLSVGHAIALTIAQERICGEIRLADFDSIELSNLNRIRTNVKNIGMNIVRYFR